MLWVAIKEFGGQKDYYDDAITRLEEFTRQDLDGDGYIGEPENPPTEINLPAPRGAKRKVRFDLPGDQRKLAWFAWAVLHPDYAVNFSFYGADQSGYGKTAFGKLRDIFLAEGWAFIKDPSIENSPLELTGDGRQFLFQLAKQASKPLPDVDLSGPEAPDSQYGRFTNIEY